MNIDFCIRKNIELNSLFKFTHEMYENFDDQSAIRLHGWCHINRVLNNIDIIIEDLDESILLKPLIAAALMHDIGYFENPNDHVRLSASECKIYMNKFNFSLNEIVDAQNIILSHSKKVRLPQKTEEHILYVADKCDMLGFDGTMRNIMEYNFAYTNRDSLASYLLDKSKVLYVSLSNTPVGKKLVEQRWEETKKFLDTVLNRSILIRK